MWFRDFSAVRDLGRLDLEDVVEQPREDSDVAVDSDVDLVMGSVVGQNTVEVGHMFR